MSIKINEFSERYPHYNRGFLAHNEPTETEKLLCMRKSFLTYSPKRSKEYQEFSLKRGTFVLLSELFKKEGIIKNFYMDIDYPNKEHHAKHVHFIGTKENNAIYSVCLETRERVLFTCESPYDINEDYSDLEGLEPYDLC